jgi:hypothetical protein
MFCPDCVVCAAPRPCLLLQIPDLDSGIIFPEDFVESAAVSNVTNLQRTPLYEFGLTI